MALDSGLIWQVARREAGLGIRSKAVWGVLVLVIVGTIFLVYSVAQSVERHEQHSAGVITLILAIFLTVVLGMVIMMNTTLVGGSISEEKDHKVVEILLSAVRAEELYIGKILGHSLIGISQLVGLWLVVMMSAMIFGVATLNEIPWGFCLAILFFTVLSYIFFTALYAIAGAIVSRNEDYMVAQIPVLFLFLGAMTLPLAPLINIGSYSDGWLPVVSVIPPFSMTSAPIVSALGESSIVLTFLAGTFLLFATILCLSVGMKVFRSRLLR